MFFFFFPHSQLLHNIAFLYVKSWQYGRPYSPEQVWPEYPRMQNVNSLALLFPLQFQLESWRLLLHSRKDRYLHIPSVRRARENENIRARVCPLREEVISASFSILNCLLQVLKKFLQYTKIRRSQVQISTSPPSRKLKRVKYTPKCCCASTLIPTNHTIYNEQAEPLHWAFFLHRVVPLFWEPPAKLGFQHQSGWQPCPNRKFRELDIGVYSLPFTGKFFHLENGLMPGCLTHDQGVPHTGSLFILAYAFVALVWLMSSLCRWPLLWHWEPDVVFFLASQENPGLGQTLVLQREGASQYTTTIENKFKDWLLQMLGREGAMSQKASPSSLVTGGSNEESGRKRVWQLAACMYMCILYMCRNRMWLTMLVSKSLNGSFKVKEATGKVRSPIL